MKKATIDNGAMTCTRVLFGIIMLLPAMALGDDDPADLMGRWRMVLYWRKP